MALLISVTYQDAYGRTTTRRVGTVSTTLAAAAVDAAALVGAMGDISDLGVTKFSIEETTPDVIEPIEGSNIDVGATLTAILDNSKKYPLHVPGIKDTKLNADGTVKIDDAAIVAYVALFLTGGHLRVSEGNFVVEVIHGELDK